MVISSSESWPFKFARKVFSKETIWSITSIILCFLIAYFFSEINNDMNASRNIIVIDILLVSLIFLILSTAFDNGFIISLKIGRRQVTNTVASLVAYFYIEKLLFIPFSGPFASLLSLLVFGLIIYLVSIPINKDTKSGCFTIVYICNYLVFFGLYAGFCMFIYCAYTDIGSESLRKDAFDVVHDFKTLIGELF